MKAYSLREARRLASGTRDWRQAIWNKWLVGYLTPRQDEQDEDEGDFRGPRSASFSKSPSIEPGQEESPPENTATHFGRDEPPTIVHPAALEPHDETPTSERTYFDTLRPGALPSEQAKAPSIPAPSIPAPSLSTFPSSSSGEDESELEWSRTRRAHTLRARLDHIVNQLDALELSVQRQGERDALLRVQDRVQQRALADILDRMVEAQERHTQSLVTCTRAVERLERRLMKVEQRAYPSSPTTEESLSVNEGVYYASSPTESIVPPSMTQRVQAPPASASARDTTAPLSGNLSEISLPTLLSMAELEHWTGRLTLETGQRTLLLDLEGGLLIGVFEDDSPSDAVEALYGLVEARDGRFAFSPQHQLNKTELAPMTVGTLLLRASHRRDEVDRADSRAEG